MSKEHWLADTNVLLRWVQPEDREFSVVRAAVRELGSIGATCCYTTQNLGEFWNVMTRPVSKNGYGLTPTQANALSVTVELHFRLLVDNLDVHLKWRQILIEHNVSGVQVHDARLVAAMHVHGVRKILTFNARDFARFTGIEAIHPAQVS